ncbi:MAG: FAD-dependent oxidoreductase [Planctomycetes bacterium]|nr:FAD-dependent oxidoreductase [Planctomycetota bacterium]
MSRVVIVGGGIIGLSCARFLKRDGHEAIVLERSPGPSGCSFGNAGLVSPSHFVPLAAPGMIAKGLRMLGNPKSPFWIRPRLDRDLMKWLWKFYRSATPAHVAGCEGLLRDISLLSKKLYVELAAESDNRIGLVQKGLLVLCKKSATLAHEAAVARRANQIGLRASLLTQGEVAALEPELTLDVCGGVHFHDDAHLNPALVMQELALGADIHYGTEVTGFDMLGDRVVAVRTTRERIEGDEFVIATGSWSGAAARQLGAELPMQAGKGYSMTIQEPAQMPRTSCLLVEARVAVTPMGGALRFAGTMEIGGVDDTVNPRRVQGICESIPRFLPAFAGAFDARHKQARPVWTGRRPVTPDGLPYLGRFAHLRNAIAAAGHAMLGISLGPATGLLVSNIIGGRSQPFSIEKLRPERFA